MSKETKIEIKSLTIEGEMQCWRHSVRENR